MSLRVSFESKSLTPFEFVSIRLPVPASCLLSLPCHMASDPLVPQTKINSIFYKLPWSWHFITAAEKQLHGGSKAKTVLPKATVLEGGKRKTGITSLVRA